MGEIAELDRIVLGEIDSFAVTDDRTDPAMTGDSEVMLGDGDLQLGQNILIRLLCLGLVIMNDFSLVSSGTACPDRQEKNHQHQTTLVHKGLGGNEHEPYRL